MANDPWLMPKYFLAGKAMMDNSRNAMCHQRKKKRAPESKSKI